MDEFHDNQCVARGDTTTDCHALILVDEADQGVGHLSKRLCHEGRGILHRAFSLLIFNDCGELLIQQRSASKRLWPLYWSNSCCSPPCGAETGAENELCSETLLREMAGGGAGTAPKCLVCNLNLGYQGRSR